LHFRVRDGAPLKLPKRESIIRDHIKQQPTQSSVTASYI
jgi:hypothetical protein